MNLILHLAPELEEKLTRLSASTGKSPETLAMEAIKELDPSVSESENAQPLGLEEWNATLDRMLASLPTTQATEVVTSQESIYDDDGR